MCNNVLTAVSFTIVFNEIAPTKEKVFLPCITPICLAHCPLPFQRKDKKKMPILSSSMHKLQSQFSQFQTSSSLWVSKVVDIYIKSVMLPAKVE